MGSVEWWLFLSSWVILTIYMTKGSMSILRSYCLFDEMKFILKYMLKIQKDVQLVIRELDKKSNYTFPEIDPQF